MPVRYLLRRALHAGLLLLGVSFCTFVLLDAAPGDYFEEVRLQPGATPETIAALRAKYGLSDPLPLRYGRWLGAAAGGDFGTSVAYNMPAAQLLLPRCGNTLLLTMTTLIIAWGLALPAGIWSAWRKDRWLDRLCSLAGTSLLAVPDVAIASILLLLASRTGRLPVGGMGDASHLVLPVLVLTTGAFPLVFRHVRAAILDVAEAPYVRAARGLGIGRGRLLLLHVLPAAANPLLSLWGLSLAGLLSSSLVVEVIFGWPGLGPLFLEAVMARDAHVILGTVLLSALVLTAANLIADLLLYAADPRIRVEG